MGAQIILAEDEPALREVISAMLEDKGLEVAHAADGIEGLEQLKGNPGASLLLSDVKMPRMDGYALVEAALTLRPELKILMMTGYAQDHPPPAALRAREIRVLAKPFPLDRLGDLVEEMLARP